VLEFCVSFISSAAWEVPASETQATTQIPRPKKKKNKGPKKKTPKKQHQGLVGRETQDPPEGESDNPAFVLIPETRKEGSDATKDAKRQR